MLRSYLPRVNRDGNLADLTLKEEFLLFPFFRTIQIAVQWLGLFIARKYHTLFSD
jgi:hypothetical protein